MIYLDYSATTPVNSDVLDSYIKVTKEYIGNCNSLHGLGTKSSELLDSATKQIASLLNVKKTEIIYTSGATESNNIAIIGACFENYRIGKKIVTSKLEHPSIYNICNYLKSLGYEIDYVNNTEEGLIDFEDLKKKITANTVLVSICGVNSEVGIRQPLKTLRQIIKKENSSTIFHSDLTQVVGKVPFNLADIDLATFSAHKFYGPKGIGILYKSEKTKIKPLMYGGEKEELRGGTPALPLIVALSKAMRIALKDLNEKEEYVKKINDRLCKFFEKFPDIQINKSSYSIPHILNISLMDVKSETFIHALEAKDIYVGSNTACSKGKLSNTVYAMYENTKRASTTIRISLSNITTHDEINEFAKVFEEEYTKLKDLII